MNKISCFLTVLAFFTICSAPANTRPNLECVNKDANATKTSLIFDLDNKKININGKEHKILASSPTQTGKGFMTAPESNGHFYVFIAEMAKSTSPSDSDYMFTLLEGDDNHKDTKTELVCKAVEKINVTKQ